MSTSTMKKVSICAGKSLAVAALILSLVTPALADIVGPAMRITASDDAGHIAFFNYSGSPQPDGTFGFSDNTPYQLYDGDTLLATINPVCAPPDAHCGALYVGDPVVGLTFSVQAGPGTTNFTIASALMSFPPINPAQGRASASFTISDFNGDGSQLVGQGPTGGAYLAQYNGFAATNSGTTFTEQIPNIAAGPFLSGAAAFNVPAVGYNAIAGTVNDMSAVIRFSLTANDFASGTSAYEIIPEPASIALLLIGVGLMARRR